LSGSGSRMGTSVPARSVSAVPPVAVSGRTSGLFTEEDSGCEENGRNGGIGEPHPQFAVVHGKRRVQEPNRGAQIPDPVEIAAHFLMGCACWGARYPSFSIVELQIWRHRLR
jgi:hypothetical protein